MQMIVSKAKDIFSSFLSDRIRQSHISNSKQTHLPLSFKGKNFLGGKRAFVFHSITIFSAIFLNLATFGQVSLQQQRQEQNNQVQGNNNNAIHQQSQQENYKEYEKAKTEIKKEKIKKVSNSKFRFVDANSPEYKTNSDNYYKAFDKLNEMFLADTTLSVKRAVYIVENAYLKNKLPYDKYLELIQNKVSLIKYIIKKEKLDETNPDAIHYAIQKLYSDTLYIKQSNGSTKMVKPLNYDFNDPFRADEQLVTKLLLTGKGQCHSMPLLYMVLAEEFKIKSYVSYSPQHSFIKFQTKNGAWFNFETTNGRLTTDAFVIGSGFVKSEALKNNIFNAPQNSKEVVANMFSDLANNYQEQFGYDNFQQKCAEKNLQYNSNYIYAKVVQSNYQTALTDLALAQENYPNPKTIPKYPYIDEQFQKRNALYDELDNLGFTTMPKEAYQQWLNSLKQGQEKQNSADLKLNLTNQLKR